MLKMSTCLIGVAVILSILVLPQVHYNWELDTCIEGCRNGFDPLKDPTSYSRCVDQCKMRYEGSMGL
jgi:hypothetical protein